MTIPSASVPKRQAMKKKRITYGVRGMMEYQSVIRIGRATLKVLFTDGSMTSLGQNPAKYTTSDFLVQRAIESSADFRRGRITVLSSMELDEDVRIERNASGALRAEEAPEAEGAAEAAEMDGGAEAPEAEGAAEAAEMDGGAEAPEVEFATNQEAREYLLRAFGVKASCKTRAEIVALGERLGVRVSFMGDK